VCYGDPSGRSICAGGHGDGSIVRASGIGPAIRDEFHVRSDQLAQGRATAPPSEERIALVTYAAQTIDAKNPLARFAHRRRSAVALEFVAVLAATGGALLDFGCGPGQFLRDMSRARPDLELVGWDPYCTVGFPGIVQMEELNEAPSAHFDVITLFETLEHLEESELVETIGLVRRILKPNGAVVVSVPIIGGPILLAKELNRYRMFGQWEYTAKELAGAVCGRPAARAADPKVSHKGFDFRALRSWMSASMACEREWLSPFPRLPWGVNSQHFSVWKLG